jgi:hypothetical protein
VTSGGAGAPPDARQAARAARAAAWAQAHGTT